MVMGLFRWARAHPPFGLAIVDPCMGMNCPSILPHPHPPPPTPTHPQASITTRKGNKRFAVFDLTVSLAWEGRLAGEGGATVSTGSGRGGVLSVRSRGVWCMRCCGSGAKALLRVADRRGRGGPGGGGGGPGVTPHTHARTHTTHTTPPTHTYLVPLSPLASPSRLPPPPGPR